MEETAADKISFEKKVRELTVPADEGQLSQVRDFIAEICSDAAFSSRETNNTKLAVDEACTNIIKHAYRGFTGEIKIRALVKPGEVEISIFDRGKRFDYASIKDPDLDQYVESGRKGGLGVFLINRLMDGVEYRAKGDGNELVLTKRSRTAISRVLPGQISWRSSLKFKFSLRASLGFFFLISVIWGFTFVHQTRNLRAQTATHWMEKRRLAENLSNKSKDVLLKPEAFSIEQTNLGVYVSKLLGASGDLAYIQVVDSNGKIVASGDINEIFSDYQEPEGELLLRERSQVVWKRVVSGDRFIRDISFPVRVRNPENQRLLTLGSIHLGVYEESVASAVRDPRLATSALLLGIFILGIMLIMLLVSVFVKPIQVLTDGVRAIGEGTLEGSISVDGPAEIGAIASVFNEVTEKFKKAKDSILEQEKLRKEMEVAKQIQQSLLPKRMPDVSGYDIAPLYQAAAEVGGDYYDFVDVDDDTVGVVVADVSGKGVPGSLVMTMIRTALRMEARGNKNASDVMAKMNDFVTDDMKKGMFVTMFYVILDSKNRIISYASAGHNPMILYRYETNETYFLNPKGFPVGISLPDETLFRRSISVEKLKLKKDDMLVIYTDGVTEAMNEKREQYGEGRLLSVIKKYGHMHPRQFIERLESDIKKFTGGTLQNDDITVVAVKEKLFADEVLFGIRKKLMDMVEVEGMSVKEACSRMKVSPATYYRYKKRMEVMGERGLKNKILRKDIDLKRVSVEERREILEIIMKNPEFGAKRIAAEYNRGKDPSRQLTERLVYDELKRSNLNTKELRLDYLRRNRLISEEELAKQAPEEARKRIVEEFLEEVSRGELPLEEKEEEKAPVGKPARDLLRAGDFEEIGEAAISVSRVDEDVAVLRVSGHIDSVSSTGLERKLKEAIRSGSYKIVVDLANVSYISSGGWGIFTGEIKRLRERGGDVVLVGMTPEVYDVFELLGFGEIIQVFDSADEASSYLKMPAEERFAARREQAAPPAAAGEALLEKSDEESMLVEEVTGEGYLPEWESLKIEATTVGREGDTAVVSLRGIIDTISADRLKRALDSIISGGINKIVIDMSQVEYVSSGGWGTFTARLREVRRKGGDIKLFGMDPDVYYVFTMLGFNIVLSSFDILSEAIEDFSKRPTGGLTPVREQVTRDEEEREEDDRDLEKEDVERIIEEDAIPGIPPEGKSICWEVPARGALVARLSGAIEASVMDRLEAEVDEEISSESKILVFDLSKVTYISSAGWGMFAKFHEKCLAWGGRVALSGMGEALFEIYNCLEFRSFILAYPSEREALLALAGADGILPEEGRESEETEVIDLDEDLLAREAQEIEAEFDDGVLSIDELLDTGQTELVEGEKTTGRASPGGAEEGEAAPGRTEGDRQDGREPGVEIGDAGTMGESEEEAQTEGDIVFTEETRDVDVKEALSDKNVGQDEKLRSLGWEKYGEKLEKKLGKRRSRPREEG